MDNIWVAIIGAGAGVVGSLITIFANHRLNGANAFSVNAKTLTDLSKRIDELEARDATKEARINDLEDQVKKWKKAYNRALNFIHREMPTVEIPDFLQDTGELNRR